jgi:hypothetical protein
MFISKIINYLIKFLELQFFIIIASLPILILWGLPISFMSPIGNLIFTPILAIFLFFSALIFFTELLGIPNKLFINILEKIAAFWLQIINLGKSYWLINFKIQYLLLSLIPIIIIAGLIVKSSCSNKKKVIFLFSLILISFSILSLHKKEHHHSISNSKGRIETYIKNGKLEIIDKGALSASNISSWINFNLLTELSKEYGTRNITRLILTRLNKSQINSIQHLIKTANLQEVDISNIKKTPLFKILLNILKENNIKIINNH